MRQPTFSRSRRHTRSYRLARTGIGFAALIVLIALVANVFVGGEEELPTPRVAFNAEASVETDGARPKDGDVSAEEDKIAAVLDDWFQRAFVDPKQFEEGDFADVAVHFTKDARAEFNKQIPTLTIGDARTELKRVTPQAADADVSMYWEGGKAPRYAYARVKFTARGDLKDSEESDLIITFSGDFTLEKAGDDWQIAYWRKVSHKQSSIPVAPEGT